MIKRSLKFRCGVCFVTVYLIFVASCLLGGSNIGLESFVICLIASSAVTLRFASIEYYQPAKKSQSVASKDLKDAYIDGFHDARDVDYLGADVFARWESSKTKRGN